MSGRGAVYSMAVLAVFVTIFAGGTTIWQAHRANQLQAELTTTQQELALTQQSLADLWQDYEDDNAQWQEDYNALLWSYQALRQITPCQVVVLKDGRRVLVHGLDITFLPDEWDLSVFPEGCPRPK